MVDAFRTLGVRRVISIVPYPCGFISATGWSTIDAIRLIEQDTRKPTVSAIQGSIWAALKRLGVREAVPGFGRLLEELGR